MLRRTMRKKLPAQLDEVKAGLRRRWPDPIPEVGQWLRSVVGGHIRYYGVPMNNRALAVFRFQVGWPWHRALGRRSQKDRVMGANTATHRFVAASGPRVSFLSLAPHERYYLRQEPSAVIPLAGISAGDGPKGTSLPRHCKSKCGTLG